jgi:uncharacterized membrane protein
MKKTKFIAQAGIIAALYAVLVVLITFTPLGGLMFGPVQFRVSEALTVLPYFTPAAIPGLFVGCIVSNLAGMAFGGGLGMLDVVFGSLATLAAAGCTYLLRRRKWLAPLPPVVINAVVVGLLLTYAYNDNLPLIVNMLSVGAGQLVVCYGLGMPLLLLLEKRRSIFL